MQSGGQELLIDFGVAGNGDTFCRSGWSQAEPRHTWTLGHESMLELPPPTEPGAYRLLIELGPFVWKDKLEVQRLIVLVNGVQIGEFALREVAPVACTIPWSILARRKAVSIKFIHPDAAKPSEVNGVSDRREIAFAFERLHFFREPDQARRPAETGTVLLSGSTDFATLPPDQLMMRFESLGENCEFGLAQRRCGAEPLGLLRFASAPLAKLLAGLEGRFEGMGEPNQVEVQVSGNGSEYLVVDRRFGFLYHPWILAHEAEPEQVRQREAMRLPFLRRKLLEDLEEGRKIFVYHAMIPLSAVDALQLFAAIRTYGPGSLLWVELANGGGHHAGTVEQVRPGLLKAYIDRFAPSENAHDLSLDCWVEICRNACRLAERLQASPD